MSAIHQQLLDEPMLRLAFVLCAWRGWLGEAISDGSARRHFEAVAAMLGSVKMAPSGKDDGGQIASLPAVRSGVWPVHRPVGLAIFAHDGVLDEVAARLALRALGRHWLGRTLRGHVIVGDQVGDGVPLAGARIAVPGLRQRTRAVLLREIEGELARAHALAAPLRKMAARAGSSGRADDSRRRSPT